MKNCEQSVVWCVHDAMKIFPILCMHVWPCMAPYTALLCAGLFFASFLPFSLHPGSQGERLLLICRSAPVPLLCLAVASMFERMLLPCLQGYSAWLDRSVSFFSLYLYSPSYERHAILTLDSSIRRFRRLPPKM